MSTPESDEIVVVPDAATLAQTAADYFVEAAARNIAQTGRCTVALSGGSTPKAMFALLASSPYREKIDWKNIYFFWGDERCVPPDHADSNYRMTHEMLLSKVSVLPENIFRVLGEKEPAVAASDYAAKIRAFFPDENLPKFDLVFLGMGADGHTASLFPFTAALHAEANKIAVENYVEKLNAHRVTLTAGIINNAKEIVFLIGGADKAAALKEVLQGDFQPELYPSQLIQPEAGKIVWLLDEAANAQLEIG